jgi:hypothetical protein
MKFEGLMKEERLKLMSENHCYPMSAQKITVSRDSMDYNPCEPIFSLRPPERATGRNPWRVICLRVWVVAENLPRGDTVLSATKHIKNILFIEFLIFQQKTVD